MPPWQLIVPDLILPQPIWGFTPELIAAHGVRGLVLDVDNTLLGDADAEVLPEVRHWIDLVRRDRPIWLISNNFSDRRIRHVAEALDLPYRSRAGKPSRRAVRYALENMAIPPAQVAMVGDRLLTDTIVGNRLGMFTVLVQPPPSATSPPSWLRWRSRIVRRGELWLARRIGANL